jgi:RNA polymerase sigma-70 factor, ECF subfamily
MAVMRSEASDGALMERAKNGDREAFADLYVRYRPALTAFLTRFTGSSALAEDLSQESFVRVWEARARFDPRREFKPLLYVSAKNLALTALKVRREPSLGDEDFGAVVAPPASLLADAATDALQSLPEPQRLALVLTIYEQFSYREAAEAMGCTEVAARVLAFRARTTLKRRLTPLLEREYGAKRVG